VTALTADIARFVAGLRYEDLPSEALPIVRMGFTDTVGVYMVGVVEPCANIVLDTIVEMGGRKEARVCFSPLRVAAPDAALVAGTAAHALDYDDQSLSGHPSAVLVSAILAEAETLGSSGRDMVTAYVAGYETWAELVRRGSNYHRKGWHPTSVFGVIGAAAAVASLRRLPVDRVVAALSIAATHSSGLSANFGTMTKPYHAGMAARAGITAVRMAAAGMTAGTDTFENPQGFLTAYSETPPDRTSPVKLGKEWYIPWQGLCLKRYPTCYFMHRSFDAAVKLLKGRNLTPADVEGIDVTMGRSQIDVLVNQRPKTSLEAKFSGHFAMAAAVVLGRMGVKEVVDSVVNRPDVQAFFPKVTLKPVEEHDVRDPVFSPNERVQIHLASGETLDSGEITSVRGQVADPFSLEEQWEKFEDCTSATHTPKEAADLFAKLQALEDLPNTSALATCTKVFPGKAG
jgi:2-methylcitrate dehydratase PrpD